MKNSHNTNSSCEEAVKQVFWYLRGTIKELIFFALTKKVVVNCYDDVYFSGLQVYEYKDTQDPIFVSSRT